MHKYASKQVYPPFGRVGSLAPPTVIRVVKASNVGGLTW